MKKGTQITRREPVPMFIAMTMISMGMRVPKMGEIYIVEGTAENDSILIEDLPPFPETVGWKTAKWIELEDEKSLSAELAEEYLSNQPSREVEHEKVFSLTEDF